MSNNLVTQRGSLGTTEYRLPRYISCTLLFSPTISFCHTSCLSCRLWRLWACRAVLGKCVVSLPFPSFSSISFSRQSMRYLCLICSATTQLRPWLMAELNHDDSEAGVVVYQIGHTLGAATRLQCGSMECAPSQKQNKNKKKKTPTWPMER